MTRPNTIPREPLRTLCISKQMHLPSHLKRFQLSSDSSPQTMTWSYKIPQELYPTSLHTSQQRKQRHWHAMLSQPWFDCSGQTTTLSYRMLQKLCGTYAPSTSQQKRLHWRPMPFQLSFDSSAQTTAMSGENL